MQVRIGGRIISTCHGNVKSGARFRAAISAADCHGREHARSCRNDSLGADGFSLPVAPASQRAGLSDSQRRDFGRGSARWRSTHCRSSIGSWRRRGSSGISATKVNECNGDFATVNLRGYHLGKATEKPVSRKARIALILSVCVLLVLAARTVAAFLRYSKAERYFVAVQIGDSRASVIARMGKPNYHAGECGVIHFPSKECAIEYVYSHPFAPLVPEYKIVSFSRDDRVIEADEWDSP
jgi:hypothetical protein